MPRSSPDSQAPSTTQTGNCRVGQGLSKGGSTAAFHHHLLGAPVAVGDIRAGLDRDDRKDVDAAEESLLRRAGDHALIKQLARAGFTGPNYGIFEDEITRYGLSVMGGWLRSGHIF